MNELVWWFGQNTLAALLMIPCVVLACRLFRDRPAVQHLLWLVILLKFLTPPVVVWPWSVDELQSMAWSQLSVHQRAHQGAPLDPSPATTMSQLIEPRSVPIESAVVPTVSAPSIEPSSLPTDVPVVADNANEKAHPTTPTNWYPIVATTAILAWFIGAIGCAFSQLRRLARYARLVRSGEVAPPHLKAEVASVASLLRMKAPVCVIVKGVVSPFLWCAGSAKLAWPDSLSSQADVVRSRGIIAHELAHLRRCDHWITWLELGASILWWWNPLFWYVRRQLRETAEMSCDALAIATNPDSRREYAEILLLLSSQPASGAPVPVMALGAGNVASFERRLKMILSSNVSGNLSWPGAVAMAVLAAIALPYWSLAQSVNREPTPTLTEQSDTAKKSRKATEPDRDNDSIVVGEKPDTSANKVPSSTHLFIAAKPKHVNFVSSGTSEILNDRSVQLNQTDRWQEYALHFSPADLPSKVSVVQLEILPSDSAQSINSKPAMLAEVKPHLKQSDGQTIQLEFSKCTFTGDVNDDSTANCIDYLSDTGWKVPEFTDKHRVHQLLLHLEKPVEMENMTEFAITIDAGGAEQFSALSRVRVSFADATSHLPVQDETRWSGTRRTITVNGQSFSFRWCPAGEFLMGSPENKRSQYGSAFVPQHYVRISRGFWLSESETTQAQYEMVTGKNPSFWRPFNRSSTGAMEHEHSIDNPVEQVSWFDASSYCQELTKIVPQHRFRLPTEAEWEYACRAGLQECRYGEINDIAWVFENSEIGTEGSFGHRKVCSKVPNAWGLHDMLGSVSEWCSDWSGPPATQPTIDPTGPTSGESRIARGGNCFADPGGLRSDGACMAGTRDQDGGPPNDKVRTRGFRIVLVANEEQPAHTPDDDSAKKNSNGLQKGNASENVDPWEISKLYEAAFLRKYLMDHEVLPKPIVVPAVRGKVRDPNGKPAPGVNLVSYTPRHGVTINPLNSGGVKKTKQDGTFGLPERTEPYRVLLTHESGVANVSHEELLRAHGVITLQKWASVTGTLKLDGKPQAGETIVLHFDPLPWSYSREKLTIIHQTTTDKDGNFSFDRVPPLGGIAHARAIGGTVYQCESGKNTHIELGVGRTVTGKLQLPEHIQKSKLQVYARNHLLPIPFPKDWTDDVTKEERLAWRMKWSATAEGSAIEDQNHIFINSSVPGAITEDGRFTIYGVPERPMVLAVAIPGKMILLEKSFDCGSGNGEIDLGTLTIADDHDHDHDHDEVHQIDKAADKPQLPRLIVKTVDSDGKPVPKAGIMFYDRNSHRAGQKEEFERVSKQTDDSGAAYFGVIPNSFGCLQVTSSDKGLAGCYTLISATMTECSQAKPPRANVQTEIKDGILTVTFTMTPHVDLEFNIVDDATNEIVFWSEIFYQDPTTNRWWQFGLVDGSKRQYNFIPISPQITRETMRISALGYETKVFRLPDELDRSQPIRRDVRLKPMPDVELKVLLPDGNPAEKVQLKFDYPNGLECLQVFEWESNSQGIVTTKFPPHADIGSFRLEHPAGTAELPMQELLDDVKQSPGKVIRRNIQLRKVATAAKR